MLSGADTELARVQFWTLGGSGECAILRPNRLLILGDLNARQSRTLAEQLSNVPYKGVIGPDDSALHFIERAAELGVEFLDPMPQHIHSLAKGTELSRCRRPRSARDDGGCRTAHGVDDLMNPLGPDWRLFCRAGKAWF